MSLQRLPSRTSDSTPKYYASRRPQSDQVRAPYDPYAAPPSSSRPKYSPPLPPRRSPAKSEGDVVEATPDPNEPEVYRVRSTQETRQIRQGITDTPATRRPAPPSGDGNGTQPPTNATQQSTPPEGETNNTSSWLNAGQEKSFNIFHLFGLGVALDNRQGLHVRMYVNLRLLLGLLVAAPVFSFVDLGDVERWRRALDVLAQLLS